MKTSLCSLFITLSLLFVFQEKKTQEQMASINLQDYAGRYQADPSDGGKLCP